MSILARLRARCPGPGGEYQVSGDDLDALLRLGEAAKRLDDAVEKLNASLLSVRLEDAAGAGDSLHASLLAATEAREQVALAEHAFWLSVRL